VDGIVRLLLATVCFLAVAAGASAQTGARPVGNGETIIYSARGAAVGRVTGDGVEGAELSLLAYVDFRTHGLVDFVEDYCANACDFGYTRIRAARVWDVDVGPATAIGTVRERTPRIWVAYKGLGRKARRIGSARGPWAPIGAAALLIVPGL